jgi:hypothetical protein
MRSSRRCWTPWHLRGGMVDVAMVRCSDVDVAQHARQLQENLFVTLARPINRNPTCSKASHGRHRASPAAAERSADRSPHCTSFTKAPGRHVCPKPVQPRGAGRLPAQEGTQPAQLEAALFCAQGEGRPPAPAAPAPRRTAGQLRRRCHCPTVLARWLHPLAQGGYLFYFPDRKELQKTKKLHGVIPLESAKIETELPPSMADSHRREGGCARALGSRPLALGPALLATLCCTALQDDLKKSAAAAPSFCYRPPLNT